ncbi:MAG: DUF2605 domain-containing protein [Synechococcales bacterium]|nr:DUF2605 domain-containing protein [Synechococcales bacterium]
MFNPPSDSSLPPDPNLLRTLLEPLLDDFEHWFSRSRSLLEEERLTFLEPDRQTDLLQRVCQAYQEVTTTRTLLNATAGQVGVDTSVLLTWHRLVHECWAVSMKRRSQALQ